MVAKSNIMVASQAAPPEGGAHTLAQLRARYWWTLRGSNSMVSVPMQFVALGALYAFAFSAFPNTFGRHNFMRADALMKPFP
ncbi:hypothetical protein T492DRAFT_909334 [Pavlovales sp. CCMP2436]|nr:hypothetical protein T492DRAFT_909334 [Pavlovales sp. CCMP2436]